MMNSRLLTLIAAVAFFGVVSSAHADIETNPSYANKKSGQVAFESKDEQSAEEAAATSEQADPSQIEPAAGAEEPAEDESRKSLADDMKLPRKN